METKVIVNVAKDFSRFPSGRTPEDSQFSGEAFREKFLKPALESGEEVRIELDGAIGYGSSFLEEAFGGLIRNCALSAEGLRKSLRLVTYDDALKSEIWSYIEAA